MVRKLSISTPKYLYIFTSLKLVCPTLISQSSLNCFMSIWVFLGENLVFGFILIHWLLIKVFLFKREKTRYNKIFPFYLKWMNQTI